METFWNQIELKYQQKWIDYTRSWGKNWNQEILHFFNLEIILAYPMKFRNQI